MLAARTADWHDRIAAWSSSMVPLFRIVCASTLLATTMARAAIHDHAAADGSGRSLRLNVPDELAVVRGILIRGNGAAGDARSYAEDPELVALARSLHFAVLGGVADIAFIAIHSPTGRFGGVRTANANYFTTRGLTGVYAPGVRFSGPVFVGDLSAGFAATPVLMLGAAADTRITGGDLTQLNGASVTVGGIDQLRFTDGINSHGARLPTQTNRAWLQQEGFDVTTLLVDGARAAAGPN